MSVYSKWKKSNRTSFGCERTVERTILNTVLYSAELLPVMAPFFQLPKFLSRPQRKVLRASSHLSTLWLSRVFRSPTHQPPSTPILKVFDKVNLRGDDPSRRLNYINGFRPAGAGQTQGSCSPSVRPTLTIEDPGTSKPASCTEFVLLNKVHKSCVN
jgi:hypothetical protein